MLNVFLKSRKGVDAKGIFNEKTKELTVLKGSRVSSDVSSSPKFRGAKIIIETRNKTTKDNIVLEDITFSSCSSAANYVTGYSSNGYVTWKDKAGKKLKDLI